MFDELRDIKEQLTEGKQLCRELKQICDGCEEGQEPCGITLAPDTIKEDSQLADN